MIGTLECDQDHRMIVKNIMGEKLEPQPWKNQLCIAGIQLKIRTTCNGIEVLGIRKITASCIGQLKVMQMTKAGKAITYITVIFFFVISRTT